jgi:hypothetical protein
MKSKGGSLYEVLKSASRPSGADEGAPTSPEPPAGGAAEGAPATLQERLAAYKAAKLAAATQTTPAPVVEAAPPKPAATTLVLEPDPTPIPPMVTPTVLRPLPPPADDTPLPVPAKGPGERMIKLTYNTALFAGMVVVGLLFVAYAVGLHVGKSHVAAEPVARPIVAAPAPPPPPPPPPVAPRKEYTIRLGEWRFVTSQEKVKALALADDPELKKQLERAGHRHFTKEFIGTRQEPRMVLTVNRFTDLNSDAARSALTAMKTFRFRGATPFANAAFEERQPQ